MMGKKKTWKKNKQPISSNARVSVSLLDMKIKANILSSKKAKSKPFKSTIAIKRFEPKLPSIPEENDIVSNKPK